MIRAPSTIEVKSVAADAGHYIVRGIATTPDVDAAGDVVVPEGAEFTLPLPLLVEHARTAPVGEVVAAEVTPGGIRFTARLPKVHEPGIVRDRVLEAVHNIKHKLLRGVSVGFIGLNTVPLNGGKKKFTRWRWLELSLVTLPCNPRAMVDSIEGLELAAEQRAAPKAVKLVSASKRTTGPVLPSPVRASTPPVRIAIR